MRLHRPVLAALVLSLLAAGAAAQRPDGSPGCSGAGCTRRDPVPDARTWIVVPFANTARAADLDWLSDASVTLLATDMSRWSDLRIVDAERVTDLLREVPQAGRTQLGLQAGLALAKRAGAGWLVMGDYLKTGARTTVTARVFDVRTGQRVRFISEPAPNADSIPLAYQHLAPKVINVPLPVGTTLAGVGTTSIEALREYTLGVQAAARWRVDSARQHFNRAVALDSTFALAELRAGGRYESAVRHSVGLPERERIIVALAAPNITTAVRCNYADRLLAHDSSDGEGWRQRGHCLLPGSQQNPLSRSRVIVGPDGRAHLDTDLNAARVAFERSLALQPGRDAMIMLMNLQMFPLYRLCSVAITPCPAANTYVAATTLERDTLAARFELDRPSDSPAHRRDALAGRRARLIRGRDFVARWVAAYPQDLGGHLFYGQYSLLLSDLAVAARELKVAAEVVQIGGEENLNNADLNYAWRGEAELRAGRPEVAAVLIDSIQRGQRAYEAAFGLFNKLALRDSVNDRPMLLRYLHAFAGVIAPDLEATLAQTSNPVTRRQRLDIGRTLAFHSTRNRPPADTASDAPLYRFQAWFALGDTARARRELREYDAWGAERADDCWTGFEMFAAESYLELGDSTTAWARIEPYARHFAGYDLNVLAGQWTRSIGRAWLLYADLATATGHRAEAVRGYRMVVGLWERGDAVVKPFVTRAKEALAKLGG